MAIGTPEERAADAGSDARRVLAATSEQRERGGWHLREGGAVRPAGVAREAQAATESQVLDAVARQRMLNQRFAKEVFEELLGGTGGWGETLKLLRETATALERGGELWLTKAEAVRVSAAATAELAGAFCQQLDLLTAMESAAGRIARRRWVLLRWARPGVAELSALCERFHQIANRATVLLSDQMTLSRAAAEQRARDAGQRLGDVLNLANGNARVAEEMARDASWATQKIMGGVHSMAAATEELTQSIQEIASEARKAAESACGAVDAVEQSNQCVKGLGGTAEAIGEIVKLIAGVAERSNLLALNASIEAARAGEAGRGFDVVAQEVKALSLETRVATEKIECQVATIQAGTKQAIATIATIHEVIERVRSASGGIAAVVEQQNVAAREIARSMHETAGGVAAVNDNVAAVVRAAEHTSRTAAEGYDAAGEVTGRAMD